MCDYTVLRAKFVQIPSLVKYHVQHKFTFKESLNAYLRAQNKQPEEIWEKMYDTIRQVFQVKINDIAPLLSNYKHPENFFELSRFDFVLDDALNVYLMEVSALL